MHRFTERYIRMKQSQSTAYNLMWIAMMVLFLILLLIGA